MSKKSRAQDLSDIAGVSQTILNFAVKFYLYLRVEYMAR